MVFLLCAAAHCAATKRPLASARLKFTVDGKQSAESIAFQVAQPGRGSQILHESVAFQFCQTALGDSSPDIATCVARVGGVVSRRSSDFHDRVMDGLARRRRACLDNRLMVVAHPDDEVIFGAEALLSTQHEGQGVCWTVVCVTRPRKDPARVVDFQNVMDRVHAHGIMLDFLDDFLGVPLREDTTFVGTESTVTVHEWLRFILSMMNWTKVVTHGPMGEYGHPQHVAVHTAVREAMRQSNMSQLLWVFQPVRWSSYPKGEKMLTSKTRSLRDQREILMQLYTTEAAARSWFMQLESKIVPFTSFNHAVASVGCDTEIFESGGRRGGFGAWTKVYRWFCRSWSSPLL